MYHGNSLTTSPAAVGAGGAAALPNTGAPFAWTLVAAAVALCTLGYLLLATRNLLPAGRRR